ncbi:MAG: type I methionyl aminopeptidase [Verrucomicrobia bacterium]|nr:type I methionyl aminopeptidase [Verrucomicrobiota bacterium]MCF7707836.1 type I methionyl aminopeptidase [Verrucomicrobiota bacterium]
MGVFKNERDIEGMRRACAIAACVLHETADSIKPGMTTREIDLYAADLMSRHGVKSAFLGYRNYPCYVCISVNDTVVHGIADERRVQFGDIVSLDVGVICDGFIGDNAKTVAVGGCSPLAQKLMDVTEQSLHAGIRCARADNRVSDISRAVQDCVESNGFSVVREFVGHGVGRTMHEEPQIPNFVDKGKSPVIKKGMTLAIEPMVNAGTAAVRILKDGWTVVTHDGKPSAHFEHTVLVTDDEPEVLTLCGKTPLKSQEQ